MDDIVFKKIIREDEIETLQNRESTIGGFSYRYDGDTLALLKRNFHRDGSLYLMARQGDDFVAFVSADTDWWEPDCYFLREIFVNPAYQGYGVGEKLVKACIGHARKNHAKAMVTETAFENLPMQKLCESNGFEKWNNPEWKEGITYRLDLA
jgi:GNAT superfamily N-acetyltransferase